jgi:hypothetical protein
MGLAPVALFCFNRVDHLKKTVAALSENTLASETNLFIFSDGPRSEIDESGVNQVRQYISSLSDFKSIHTVKREKNLGLAESIITGVTDLLQRYDRVIVMEDDLVTSPYFLQYMNDGLALYEKDEVIASIHGYMYPVRGDVPETFFIRGADCWGWGTWARAWKYMERDGQKLLDEVVRRNLQDEFDYNGAHSNTNMLKAQIEGRNNSWAVRWHGATFLRGMLTLYPSRSLVSNIGFDSTGTHCGNSNAYEVQVSLHPISLERIALKEDKKMKDRIEEFFWEAEHGKVVQRIPFRSSVYRVKNYYARFFKNLTSK